MGATLLSYPLAQVLGVFKIVMPVAFEYEVLTVPSLHLTENIQTSLLLVLSEMTFDMFVATPEETTELPVMGHVHPSFSYQI